MDGSISVVKDDLTLDATGVDFRLPRSKKHIVVKREHLVKQATGGTSYAPSTTITFDLPASERGLVGPLHYFSAIVTLPVNTNYIGGSVKNLISSLKISNINGEVLEEYDQVGLLEKIIRVSHLSKDYQEAMLAPEGVYDSYAATTVVATGLVAQPLGTVVTMSDDYKTFSAAAANTIQAYNVSDFQTVAGGLDWTAGKLMVFQLNSSGILMNKKHLPLAYIGGLRIELILTSAALGLTAGTDFTITYPKFHYVLADYSDKVKAALSEAHRSGKLHIYYDTWSNRSVSTTATSLNVELNKPVLMLKNIYAAFRTTASLAAANDSFVLNGAQFPTTNTSRYQFIHNDIRYPSQQVSSVQQAYMEFLKATNQLGDVDQEVIPFKNYILNQFVICQDFEMIPEGDNFTASSTKGNKGIIFEFSRVPTTDIRADFFTHYTRVVTMLADGTVRTEE